MLVLSRGFLLYIIVYDFENFRQSDRTKCPLYRGVRIIEVGNVWFLVFLGPNELSVIEKRLFYSGVRKERLDCIYEQWHGINILIKMLNCFIHRLVAKYSVKVIEVSTMVPENYLLR